MSLDSCQLELSSMVGSTGDVKGFLGGFEIDVIDEGEFPWGPVFEYLMELAHSIWITKREGVLVIKTKPPSV